MSTEGGTLYGQWKIICPYNIGQVWNYDYTGGEQTFTVTEGCSGTYKLEVWGAQGGNYSSYIGGYGAYSIGQIDLTNNTNLYVNVGGTGGLDASIGYNSNPEFNGSIGWGANGGGATHIASISGELHYLVDRYSSLIVAGGGGGAADRNPDTEKADDNGSGNGGCGGGIYGCDGVSVNNGSDFGYAIGTGGSQTENGYCKFNFNSECTLQAGGGGGYYDGGYSAHGGAGGGSGYIANPNLTNKHMTCYNCTTSTEENTYTISNTNVSSTPISDYSKTGNGYARITLLSYE